jgi:hypothetical protein
MTKDEARDCDHGRMKGKCEVCDLQAELDATNRQVEILSDALAESRRQRQWAGLTDEEKRQIFEREDYQGWLDYINAIEAKLKERNT